MDLCISVVMKMFPICNVEFSNIVYFTYICHSVWRRIWFWILYQLWLTWRQCSRKRILVLYLISCCM